MYFKTEYSKAREEVKSSVVARAFFGGEMDRQVTEDFWGSGNPLCDPLMMDTCHRALFQAHRMCTIGNDLLSTVDCEREPQRFRSRSEGAAW